MLGQNLNFEDHKQHTGYGNLDEDITTTSGVFDT